MIKGYHMTALSSVKKKIKTTKRKEPLPRFVRELPWKRHQPYSPEMNIPQGRISRASLRLRDITSYRAKTYYAMLDRGFGIIQDLQRDVYGRNERQGNGGI